MRIVLETERLVLRELVGDDCGDLCRLLQDEKAMYAYEGAFSNKEVNDRLDRQLMRYRDDGFGLWGMVGKESGKWLGQCGITMQEYKHRRVPENRLSALA